MEIEEFLTLYPQNVRDLLQRARAFLLSVSPVLVEELDAPSRILVYRIAPGNAGIVFTLILSRTGVKLGLYRGRSLPDPSGLMEGSGKVHSTISLNADLFENPALHALTQTALQHAQVRISRS